MGKIEAEARDRGVVCEACPKRQQEGEESERDVVVQTDGWLMLQEGN